MRSVSNANDRVRRRQSLWWRILTFAWCGRHSRTMPQHAPSGVYWAERARAGVNELQMLAQQIAARLSVLDVSREGEARQLELGRRLDTNIDNLTNRVHVLEVALQRLDYITSTLTARVGAIAERGIDFQHEARIRRRWLAPSAASEIQSRPRRRLPIIGVISTWNSRCGIAAYVQSLCCKIDRGRLRVFASRVAELLQPDDSFVRRCWTEGWSDPLDELFREVLAANVDVVVLQFNFGLFQPLALQRLLDRLYREGILVFVTLHATMDVNIPGMVARLGDLRTTLGRVCRLLVTFCARCRSA